MSVDFLPESYRQKRQLRALKRLCGVLAVCLMAVAATWGAMQFSVSGRLAAHADALAEQAASARATHDELARVTEEHRVLQRQAKIGRELSMPLHQADLMHLLGETMPETVGLTELEVRTVRPRPTPIVQTTAVPGARPARPTPNAAAKPAELDRLELRLAGVAPSDLVVAELVNALTNHAVFDAVTLHGSRPVDRFGYQVRLFELSLQAPLDRRFIKADDAEITAPRAGVEVTP
ncbi:MAG: hypothetical protein AAGB29_03435 [Planctomycetota bacterium]